jgi:hypothetical protein
MVACARPSTVLVLAAMLFVVVWVLLIATGRDNNDFLVVDVAAQVDSTAGSHRSTRLIEVMMLSSVGAAR